MTELVTLPVYCASCGGAVTLQMSEWPVRIRFIGAGLVDDARARYQRALQVGVWACPWCRKDNDGGFPGKVAWAAKGHQSAPTV